MALLLVLGAVVGGSFYMLSYSLTPREHRGDMAAAYRLLYQRMPDMKPWMDSLTAHDLLRDTFVMMPSGYKAHALYLRADSAHGRTALLVHGYKDCAVSLSACYGRMFNRDLHYNVLMPDLYAHGLSQGDHIQMGWNDRLDIEHWAKIAHDLFATPTDSVQLVVHGVSMGAATTMCVAGDSVPSYIKCFIEDCGYTSAWDEFEQQLHDQFALPAFPLMYSTSALCRLRYGWSFGQASPLRQVARCRQPMLFIHGGADTFVPTRMVYRLYAAKPQPKALWIAPKSGHARAYMDHPADYTARVKAFVWRYIK